MQPKIIGTAVRLFMTVGPSIKSWIFSDGKFSSKRAGYLIVTLFMLMLGAYFIGPENLEHITNALDEISDVIGYDGD